MSGDDFFRKKEGVRGVIICDLKGNIIKSNIPDEQTEGISEYITTIINQCEQFIYALKEGALNCIRLDTSQGEIMIAREEDLILIILK